MGWLDDALGSFSDSGGGGSTFDPSYYGNLGSDASYLSTLGSGSLGAAYDNGQQTLGYDLTGEGGYSLPAGTPGITADTGFNLGGGDSGGFSLGGVPISQLMGLLGQGVNLGTALNGLRQANRLGNQAAAADPLAPYRAGFARQLNDLMQDPSKITSMPGYEAGLQAVQRSMGAQGMLNSGNEAAAIADFGGRYFDTAVGRLQGLAGGTAGGGLPATEAGINLTNSSLNRIMSGIASMGT